MSLLLKNNQEQFWITNVSKKNVCLADLALTIPAQRSLNLLDSKHFTYTLEQLQQSAANGSLYLKADRVKVRHVPPKITIKPGIYVINEPRPSLLYSQLRSQVVIEEKQYEELIISDEKFAEEFSALSPEALKNLEK